MTGRASVTILIPAYNEEKALRSGKLQPVMEWVSAYDDAELVVIDDGSLDATAELAREQVARLGNRGKVLEIPHSGKARAVVAGILAASKEVVLFTDMDQATPISDAPLLLDAIQAGVNIAIGSRGLVRPGAPIGRYILSWGQVGLRWLLLGLLVTDTQCGFKAFSLSAAQDILDHLRLYHPSRLGPIQGPSVSSGFDTEFLFVARRLGYRIQELPVHWNYQQTRRVRLIRDALRGFNDLLRIAFANIKGAYSQ